MRVRRTVVAATTEKEIVARRRVWVRTAGGAAAAGSWVVARGACDGGRNLRAGGRVAPPQRRPGWRSGGPPAP